MNEQKENYSDIEKARQISQKLRPNSQPISQVPKQQNYLSFQAAKLVFGQAGSASSYNPLVYNPPIRSQCPDNYWNNLLLWYLENSKGSSAFIIDQEGFVVAYQGQLSAKDIEEIGARLVAVFHQANKFQINGEELSTLRLEYPNNWVTSLLINLNENVTLLVGLISSAVENKEILSAIKNAITSTPDNN